MTDDYLRRILTAEVYDVAVETALGYAPLLSARLENRLLLKREDEQPTFSFKCRGAYNKMAKLGRERLAAGVIAASAGNHAQGVALAARRLDCHALIVMPATTPAIKVDAVEALGASVVLHGDSYAEAEERAREIEAAQGQCFVHPYDDADVIAGQGTVAMEIVRQHPDVIDTIFVPVGGGGLIAGIAAYVKALRPEIRIVGVEPQDSAAMQASLAQGRIVRLEHVGMFADGVAVKQVGQHTFALVQELVDEIVTVDNDEICAAIKDVFEDTRSIMEPAGVLGVAGAKLYVEREGVRARTLIAVLSGANMNFDRLRYVAERAELGEQREAILAVTIPERPGSLGEFCSLLGQRNITEFNYRYASADKAQVFVGVTVHDHRDTASLVDELRAAGLETVDLSGNEMAKLHVRHMVGGRAPGANDELLCRFEFPERPGALVRFLERMNRSWNISLFHYRNHGTDYGRVLIGMQVPAGQRKAYQDFLDGLGYAYCDESANPAFHLFLA